MKTWEVTLWLTYEGYNGYNHTNKYEHEVRARNADSALKKAKKWLKGYAGGEWQRGSIRNASVFEKTNEES